MSKLFTEKEKEGDVQRWELPDVDPLDNTSGYSRLLTASQIEKIQKQAYDEGFKQGHQAGYKSGEADLQNDLKRLDSIMGLLEKPLQDLDQEIVQQLLELTTIIAGQVIRRELRADPGQVIAVVRACLKDLPIAARKVSIYVHPDDATLIRGAFSIDAHMDHNWQIAEDPVMTRGGCRIEAENSKIDASVEQQLNRVIANLMGGERERDTI
jgi:flagellar assembly protein FliH